MWNVAAKAKILFNFLDERIQIISFYQIDALMRFYFEVGEIGLKINELRRNIFWNRENSVAMWTASKTKCFHLLSIFSSCYTRVRSFYIFMRFLWIRIFNTRTHVMLVGSEFLHFPTNKIHKREVQFEIDPFSNTIWTLYQPG